MCGACAKEPICHLYPPDVVRIKDRAGATPKIGKVDAIDTKWGIGIVFSDGGRTWYSYDMWCPTNFGSGFSCICVDEDLFELMPGAIVAPPEVGRGWLQRPPAKPKARPVLAHALATPAPVESGTVDDEAAYQMARCEPCD